VYLCRVSQRKWEGMTGFRLLSSGATPVSECNHMSNRKILICLLLVVCFPGRQVPRSDLLGSRNLVGPCFPHDAEEMRR